VASKVLQNGLPRGVVLSVNVPDLLGEPPKGFQVTRQGQRIYHEALDARSDPRGNLYYWIGGDHPTGVVEEHTDFGAVAAAYISVTPLQLDLTAYAAMEGLRGWEWE
jgi:5'-nucleotidase